MLGGGFKCVLLYTPFGQDCHHGKLTPKQQNLEDQINLSDSMGSNLVIVVQDLFKKSLRKELHQNETNPVNWVANNK